jgi:hypothetical protein
VRHGNAGIGMVGGEKDAAAKLGGVGGKPKIIFEIRESPKHPSASQ